MHAGARRSRPWIAATCLVWAAACGDATEPPTVTEVSITPDPATVRVGESVTLRATATDQNGNPFTNPDVTWTSVDASIASVNGAGVVRGMSEGTTDVSAVVEGAVKTVPFVVTPARVVSVDVRPLVAQVLIGSTIQMTATPKGAGGTPLPGRTIAWSTLTPAIASVSPTGLVTGIADGEATIVATVEQLNGSTTLVVTDPTAPRIQSISPFPLVEGQPAIVTGLNFGATAGANAVTVDGVTAAITVGSPTSVTFTVPATGCRPSRTVPVRVTAGGKSGTGTQALRPATFTAVGIGELIMLPGPAACLQLDAVSASESYLVGVQSVAEDPASVTQVQVISRTGLSASGASVPQPAPLPSLSSPVPTVAPRESDAERLLAAHARRHLEAREAEAALLSAGLDFSAAASGALPSAIPSNATVGQRFNVRVPPHYPGSCTQFNTIQAELRLVTARGQWLVDVSNLATTYTAAQLQTLADIIENGVVQTLEPMFGPLPDTDTNPRIAFVITSRVNDQGWLSYPSLYDYLPTSQCAASNEGDFLYVATPQAVGGYSASLLLGVMGFSVSHDFTHVIQNRAVIAGGSRAPAWIEEGQAGIGEESYAHRVTARTPRQNYGQSVMFSQIGAIQPYAMVGSLGYFFGFQDVDAPRVAGAPELCTWLNPQDGGTASPGPCLAPGPSGGAWAFLRWLTDHYGDDVGGDGVLHQGLIDTPGTGFARVETLLGVPIEALLARFAATLYVDDRIVPVEPTLDFPSWNLVEYDAAVDPAARLVPRQKAFTGLTENASVRAASTLYYDFSASSRSATAIQVSGPSGASLSATTQVWVVRLR